MNKKGRGSRGSKTKSTSLSHAELESLWIEAAKDLDLNAVDPKRNCFIVLGAERTEAYTEIVDLCRFAYQNDQLNAVKCVTYEDFVQFVWKSSTMIQAGVVDEIDLLIKQGCSNAVNYLDSNKIIPCGMVAKLLKFYIMTLIKEDVIKNKANLLALLEKEIEKNMLLKSIEDVQGGGKKNAKDKNEKKGAKDQKKGDKKGKGAVQDDDICKEISKFELKLGPLPKVESIELPFKELYFILIGFYDAMLIKELIDAGAPFTCVLEFSGSESTHTTWNSLHVSTPEITTDSTLSSDPLYTSEASNKTEDSGLIVEASKYDILQAFWEQINDLFEGHQQYQFLQNAFHLKFIKHIQSLPDFGTEQYVDLSEKCLKHLTDFVLDIKEIKRRYINYIRNMRLQYLGDRPRKVAVQTFKTYNKLLDRFPPECFNIALLTQCILEEVSTRVPSLSESSLEDLCAVSKESLYLEGEEESVTEDGDEEMNVTHGNVRDQLIGIFKKYKKRNKISLPGATVMQCRRSRYLPRINTRLSSNPFIVHEKNHLEIMANSYKGLCEELFAVNLRALKRCRAVLSWNECTHIPEIVKLMNKYYVETWQNNLGLSAKELRDALHLFLFNTVICKEYAIDVRSNTSLCKIFPKKEKAMIMEEAKPRVFKPPDNAESDTLFKTILSLTEDNNVYEELDLVGYSWKENLTGPAALQQLQKAHDDYLCMDYKYCKIVDAILIRFHNNMDEFGCNTRVWDKPLRTPVCLRDFCKYVVHEDTRWLEHQEDLFNEELEEEARRCAQMDYDTRQSVYADLVVNEHDFILPGSLKDQALKAAMAPPVEEVGTDKKGGNKKDKGDKKGKGGKGESGKDAAAPELTPAQISVLEKLTKPTVPPRPKLPSLHCAETGSAHSFIGYDLAPTRLQLIGSTTTFLSLDGVKVTVDKTGWLGGPPNLSLNITSNNHTLTLHHNHNTVKENFMFHLHLSNNTIIALAKPLKLLTTEVALCEKICHALKETKRKSQDDNAFVPKRQEMYFVSEKQNYILKSFRIPYISKRSIILSETLLIPFLESLERLDIRAQIKPSEDTVNSKTKRKHNLDSRVKQQQQQQKPDHQLHYQHLLDAEKKSPKHGLPKVITKKVSEYNMDESLDEEEFMVHARRESTQTKTGSQICICDETLLRTKKEFLDKLKLALHDHIPVFKICSSRLHKYTYVKRCKSYLSVPIGGVIKRVLCKPSYCRTKRNIEVTKCFPIGITANGDVLRSNYDLRISLPSGLVVRNVPGLVPENFHIKQYYVDKGPQCKNIAKEDSRTFMRNGNIMIKFCDGSVSVFNLNGNILKFEVPYVKKTRVFKPEYKNRIPKEVRNYTKYKTCAYGSVPLHACSNSLSKYQKVLHRIIRRFQKHSIDGTESRYHRSRNTYLRRQKKYMNDPDQFYFLQTGAVPFPKYSLIKPDGTKMTVSTKNVCTEQKYYTTFDQDYLHEQTYFEREDGMHYILDREGLLSTQYPDGTRITTWFTTEPDLIYMGDVFTVEDSNTKFTQYSRDDSTVASEGEWCAPSVIGTEENSTVEEIQSSVDLKSYSTLICENDGWVSVHLYYQYDHPNYATVIFGGPDDDMKIVLPDEVEVINNNQDVYQLQIDKTIKVTVDTETIEHISSCCNLCRRGCRSLLNISQLYHGKEINEKSDLLKVTDSYRKIFAVAYDGTCRRNYEYLGGLINEAFCTKHTKIKHQKLFVLKRDLTGILYWNKSMYENKHKSTNESGDGVINVYGNEFENTKSVEFRTYIYQPYHQNFVLAPKPAKLMLAKYRIRTENNTQPLCYIKQRTINQIPSYAKLSPLYQQIIDCCKFAHLDSISFQMNFYDFVERIHQECKHEKICKELSLMSESTTTEDFVPTITMFDKWYAWQEECKRLKHLIREQYVPLYFQSVYGNMYRDSYIVPSSDQEMSQFEQGISPCTNPSTISNTTTASGTITLEKDLCRTVKVKKTESAVIETITEQVRISLPKDLVIMSKGGKHLEIQGDQNEGVVAMTQDDLKLLVMTNVKDSSKVMIARRFDQNDQALTCKCPETTDGIICQLSQQQVCTSETNDASYSVCEKTKPITTVKDDPKQLTSEFNETNADTITCTLCSKCGGKNATSDDQDERSCSICDICIEQKEFIAIGDLGTHVKPIQVDQIKKGSEVNETNADPRISCTLCSKCGGKNVTSDDQDDYSCSICDACMEQKEFIPIGDLGMPVKMQQVADQKTNLEMNQQQVDQTKSDVDNEQGKATKKIYSVYTAYQLAHDNQQRKIKTDDTISTTSRKICYDCSFPDAPRGDVPKTSTPNTELVYHSKERRGTIPIYDETKDNLKYARLEEKSYETYSVDYVATPAISDNVRLTVSKVVSLLFNVGPYLTPIELDRLIHPILKQAQVTESEIEALSKAVQDEILNGDWLSNFHMADSTFDVLQDGNGSVELFSSGDTIKVLVRMLKKHLKKQLLRKPQSRSLQLSDISLKKSEQKVTSYLGDVVNLLIDKLRFHVGTLTYDKRLAIVNSALQGISEARLRPDEVLLFLKNLDSAAQVEIRKLPARAHFDESGGDGSCSVDEKEHREMAERIFEPLIESIRRYNQALPVEYLPYLKVLSDMLVSKSSERLVDKSKPVSITKVTRVLKNYRNAKLAPYLLMLPQKIKSDSSEAISPSNVKVVGEEDYIKHVSSKGKVSFSRNIIDSRAESSVTVLHFSGAINAAEQVDSIESLGKRLDSASSSKVTVTNMPEREQQKPSMAPYNSESVQNCEWCNSNDEEMNRYDKTVLIRSISDHKASSIVFKQPSITNEVSSDVCLLLGSNQQIEKSVVAAGEEEISSDDITSYNTEDALVLDQFAQEETSSVERKETLIETFDPAGSTQESANFLNIKEQSPDLKTKKPFLYRKAPSKKIAKRFEKMAKPKEHQTDQKKTMVEGLTVIHESKHPQALSTTMLGGEDIETCSACVKSIISSHVSLCDFHKSKSTYMTSSMRPIRSRMSFNQSSILRSIQMISHKKPSEQTPSMTPTFASSLFNRRVKVPSEHSSETSDVMKPFENSEKTGESFKSLKSVGAQTQRGNDLTIQTSNDLLKINH